MSGRYDDAGDCNLHGAERGQPDINANNLHRAEPSESVFDIRVEG